MLGSIDCIHWTWKNCPKSWAGQFTGKKGKVNRFSQNRLIVRSLELVAFFGLPSSLNDP